MIYTHSVLQKKIIPLFHYTLNPGGILFLGTSESIGENTDLFQPLNSKWKLFERQKGLAGVAIAYPAEINYGGQQRSESAELQNKVDEFTRSNDDMNNLLAATEISSIFLDTDLCIKRYTPAVAKIIRLIQTDIGRPLSDLKTGFPDVDLVGQSRKVLNDLNTVEMEIQSKDFIWYALKVMPYRTTDPSVGRRENKNTTDPGSGGIDPDGRTPFPTPKPR